MSRPKRQSWAQVSAVIRACNPTCLNLSFGGHSKQAAKRDEGPGQRGHRTRTVTTPVQWCSPSARISTGPHWQMEEVGKFASARTERPGSNQCSSPSRMVTTHGHTTLGMSTAHHLECPPARRVYPSHSC